RREWSFASRRKFGLRSRLVDDRRGAARSAEDRRRHGRSIDGQNLRIGLLRAGRSNADWLLWCYFGKSKLQFGGRLVWHAGDQLCRRRLFAPARDQFYPVPTTIWAVGLL